ncbi:hypothetical protein [Aliarcobacter lanthieri]|uniref:hypothetical protein n=1 Tax=Aliarcobacter lanthieri TaxID=1355374 RepID=UPI00047E6D72|nr:hypothetical protein [Aliarcobacter lanthieri]
MHKELHSVKLIRDYMEVKDIVKSKLEGIDDVFNFFNYLVSSEGSNKFNSLYILNYINQYIVDEEVAKRKTSARVFEDLLAIIFNGEVTDSKKRKNLNGDVPDYFKLTKDKIAGNKREKIDLIFNDNYGISLKTLMMNNKEINLGSFEKKVLFDGFDVSKYLTERKTEDEIGLGSIPRLTNLLNKIKEENNYEDFQERFSNMFNYIFADDMILAIKDKGKLELYFFKGEEFTNFVSSKVVDINLLVGIVNRWEGNSIRIDRTKLLESCSRKVVLDLSKLNDTVIKLVNELDFKLHKSYIEYFNSNDNKEIKNNIISELEKLFDEFDTNIKKLK